jgi:hypothetical protein
MVGLVPKMDVWKDLKEEEKEDLIEEVRELPFCLETKEEMASTTPNATIPNARAALATVVTRLR